MLIATAGFESLPGLPTTAPLLEPDFELPEGFFNPAGDTVRLCSTTCSSVYQTATFGAVPTDGVMSLSYPAGTTATNSPTNFAGTTGSVDLSVAPEPSGDYNGNGVVDAADYTAWRDTLGQSVAMAGDGADGDQSGDIDAGDYSYWVERFGNVVPNEGGAATAHLAPGDSPGANYAVPEPAASLLILLTIGCYALQRRPRLRS